MLQPYDVVGRADPLTTAVRRAARKDLQVVQGSCHAFCGAQGSSRPGQSRTGRGLTTRQAILTMLGLRFGVWRARMFRNVKTQEKKIRKVVGQGLPELPDLDLNVLPPMLPKRAGPYTLTEKVWRKIVYWARIHNFNKHGTINQFSSLAEGKESAQVVAVLGGGAFGTAMAAHVARKGHKVLMVVRKPEVRDFINKFHINPGYLSEWDLPTNLEATTDLKVALGHCNVFIHALPVQSSRKALQEVRKVLPENVPVIAVSKGVELGTRQLMCEVIPEALGRAPETNPVVVVSGPSFAQEIMDRRPTSVVAASTYPEAALQVQRLLTSRYFRVSTTDDVTGVEVAGAFKNVLAIAAGIVEGLGLGLNAMSALVTQGNAEIRWLATAMGAKPETLAGLSGMGDILLTCYGSLSRNRSVGVRLGRGESLESVLSQSGGVAEGVYTSKLVVELADHHRVLVPVLTSVARILSSEVSPRQAVFEVLALPPLAESA